MSIAIIITFCTLLLIAYVFDLTSSRTRIPSVILLMLLGWVIRQITHTLNFDLPDLSPVLPTLGTIGLILIVLEGSLELELNRSKLGMIRKSFLGSLASMAVSAYLLAFLFSLIGGHSYHDSLINAVPFCIISSAVAIPSVRYLTASHREYVVYESSVSDILGVLFFNYVTVNQTFSFASVGHFGLQLVLVTLISFAATIGLSFLLSRIEHHIKFVPIVLLVTLIYSIAEIFHLPALIIILMFGLFLGNLEELKKLKYMERFQLDALKPEVKKFKDLIIEGSFLVRAIFFLLFGFLLETADILNSASVFWSVIIVYLIIAIRMFQLRVSNLPMKPLLLVAPRGLITILLFLSVAPGDVIPIVNKSLVIQVVIITSLLMMIGLMSVDNEKSG